MEQTPDNSTPKLLIERSLDGVIIPQRPSDGYINATKLCQSAGKLFADYRRLATTQEYLDELSLIMGIPIINLVQVRRGRIDPLELGTWVHPYVATHVAQWASPTFAVQVNIWVVEWMKGIVTPDMPVHVRRYLMNKQKIPHTHFSMLNEIYITIFATLEHNGVIIPDSMMPDISTGKLFSNFLRDKGIDPNTFPSYEHEFADDTRKPVPARLYPVEYLADFRTYLYEVWLPQRAEQYFLKRLPAALPYLPIDPQLPSP